MRRSVGGIPPTPVPEPETPGSEAVASGHGDLLAGDVLGSRVSEEEDGAGDLAGATEASERHFFDPVTGDVADVLVVDDDAGGDGVHGDAVADLLRRVGPRQRQDRRL